MLSDSIFVVFQGLRFYHLLFYVFAVKSMWPSLSKWIEWLYEKVTSVHDAAILVIPAHARRQISGCHTSPCWEP